MEVKTATVATACVGTCLLNAVNFNYLLVGCLILGCLCSIHFAEHTKKCLHIITLPVLIAFIYFVASSEVTILLQKEYNFTNGQINTLILLGAIIAPIVANSKRLNKIWIAVLDVTEKAFLAVFLARIKKWVNKLINLLS
jgi:hypothetical protein